MLTGLKTYIVAAIAILSAAAAFLIGDITLFQALAAAGVALGLGGNRYVAKAVELANATRRGAAADPELRIWVTHIGTALAVLTAILAGINGEQSSAATIAAVLTALGVDFLGLGVKNAAT